MHTTFEQIFDLGPFSWPALFCCAINGLMIGIERQTRGKPVGIRTAILIISGTYLFMSMAVMIGLGYLMQSVVITLLALSVLLGVDKAENRIKALRRGVHQKIQQRKTSSRLIK